MDLRKILFPAFIGMFLLSFAADARYIFVLPPTGAANPVIQGYTEGFASMGPSIPVPTDTSQVLTNITGTKAIIIAANGAAPVSFLTIQNSQLVGPIRSIPLEGKAARSAVLTPDGSKVLVLTGSNPGVLFVIDLATEAVVSNGRIQILNEGLDLVVSADSRVAYVLSMGSPSTFAAVDLATGTAASQAISGVGSGLSISISPLGQVYVTSLYGLIEFNGQAPYAERARSRLLSHPGKLKFSPDGRYALAKNVLGTSSVVALDLGTKNADYPAGIQLSQASITTPDTGNSIPLPVEDLVVISDQLAIAYVAAVQKMFVLQYPLLSATEINLAQVGSPTAVSGIAITNEYPTAREIYYNSGGLVTRHDLVKNISIGTNAGVLTGPIFFGAAASTSTPVAIFGVGGNQTVAPLTALRYAVRVTDSQNRPAYNQTVTFSAGTGTTLSSTTAVTNMFGYASVVATAPTVNGDFNVSAAAGAVSAIIKSTVTGGSNGGGGGGGGNGGPKIVKISGDGQLRPRFDALGDPLIVQVQDADGNPITGKTVTWTEQGGVNFSTLPVTTTDAKGMSQALVIPVGDLQVATPYLTYSITANSDGIGSVVFSMAAWGCTNQQDCFQPQVILSKPPPENRTITVKLGSTNVDALNGLLISGGGNGTNPTPIPGVALNVGTGNTDPKAGVVATCEGGTPVTGTDGVASCNLIATGQIGTVPLFVNFGGLRFFTDIKLTVTPGDPIAPIIKQGNNQSGKPGTTLPVSLGINLVDAFGNTLAGVPVAWTTSPIGAVTLVDVTTTSDESGNAKARVILGPTAGAVQVKATAGGKEAIFNITIESLVSGMVKVSGDNQPITPINQAFPSPLIVQVTPAVAGAVIQWTATGGALLSATSVPTGTDGRSQVTVTAGPAATTITVTASLQGFTPITFQLQSRLPGPTLTPNSFVNWATNEAGLAPGNLVLLIGTGLAPNLKGTVNASLLTGALPFTLADVTVKFTYQGGEAWAPIYRVSNENNVESVLLQVPFPLVGASANAVVNVAGGSTTVTGITLRAASPGILEDSISGRRAAVAVRSDGLFVTPESPARRGEAIRIYTIGLGQTTPPTDTNRLGSADQVVGAAVTVGLDGGGFAPTSVHTAENLVGVYEIEFIVPQNATIGSDRPLNFTVVALNGTTFWSNGSVISIGQ